MQTVTDLIVFKSSSRFDIYFTSVWFCHNQSFPSMQYSRVFTLPVKIIGSFQTLKIVQNAL